MSQVSQDCPEIRVTPVNPVLPDQGVQRVRLVCLETPETQELRVLPARRVPRDRQA